MIAGGRAAVFEARGLEKVYRMGDVEVPADVTTRAAMLATPTSALTRNVGPRPATT